jgi:hypothetical protein
MPRNSTPHRLTAFPPHTLLPEAWKPGLRWWTYNYFAPSSSPSPSSRPLRPWQSVGGPPRASTPTNMGPAPTAVAPTTNARPPVPPFLPPVVQAMSNNGPSDPRPHGQQHDNGFGNGMGPGGGGRGGPPNPGQGGWGQGQGQGQGQGRGPNQPFPGQGHPPPGEGPPAAPGSRHLFIGGLPGGDTEELVGRTFGAFGPLESVRIYQYVGGCVPTRIVTWCLSTDLGGVGWGAAGGRRRSPWGSCTMRAWRTARPPR